MEDKTEDGTFLVRRYDDATHAYVMSVVFRGKPTHHLMSVPPSETSKINKRDTGQVGLAAVSSISILLVNQ